MSDIYVVQDGTRIIDRASTKLQGAELIRAEEADRIADQVTPPSVGGRESMTWKAERRHAYDRMTIANIELQDDDS